MRKTGLVFLCIGIMHAVSCAQSDNSDYLTITTYYPSPYGVYGTLKLQPKQQPATCREGEMTYSNNTTPRGLYYCNDSNAWQLLAAGGGGGYWAEDSDGYLSNINSGGQVIIKGQPGATGPNEEILEAQGDIRVFHRPPLGDGNTLIYLTRSNATSTGALGFTTWDGSDPGYGIIHWGNPQKLSIRTGPPGWVRSLTIADDKVGIGTTAPAEKLEVAGRVRADGALGTGHAQGFTFAQLQQCHPGAQNPYAAPDATTMVTRLMATIAACSRRCGNGAGGGPGCVGLGYHGGTAVEWNPMTLTVVCECY